MNIVKPYYPSPIFRVIEVGQRFYYVFSSIWAFRLSDGGAVAERHLWSLLAGNYGDVPYLDAGFPKVSTEFFVEGCFYPPTNSNFKHDTLAVSLGNINKHLLVSGNRFFNGSAVCGPVAFDKIPVSYTRAYGGPKVPANPVGLGNSSSELAGINANWLPNIEYPDNYMTSPASTVRPASMSRIPMHWPLRTALSGTFSADMSTGFPGDFDWCFFYDTAADQRFKSFIVGDEPFVLQGLHAEKAVINGQLPKVRCKMLVQRALPDKAADFWPQTGSVQLKRDAKFAIETLTSQLDTVGFFPEHDLGLVVHRAILQGDCFDAADISAWLIAYEALDEPAKPDSFYIDQLQKRLADNTSLNLLIDTSPLLPTGLICEIQAMMNTDELGNSALERRFDKLSDTLDKAVNNVLDDIKADTETELSKHNMQEHLTKVGIHSVEELFDPGQQYQASPGDTQDSISALMSDVDDSVKPFLADINQALASKDFDQLLLLLNQLSALQPLNATLGKVVSLVDKQLDTTVLPEDTGIPTDNDMPDNVNVSAEIAKIRAELKGLTSTDTALAPLPRFPAITLPSLDEANKAIDQLTEHATSEVDTTSITSELSELEQKLQQFAQELPEYQSHWYDMYLNGAHLIHGASPYSDDMSVRQKRFLDLIAGQADLSNADYPYLQLENVTIATISFVKSLFEYSQFNDVMFSNVHFDHSVLTAVTFVRCSFVNCTFLSCNLGRASLSHCQFQQCQFTKTNLSAAVISNSCFEASSFSFDAADLQQLSIDISRFTDCSITGWIAIEKTFTELSFVNCVLEDAIWLECTLVQLVSDKSKLSQSVFTNSTFIAPKFNHSIFSHVVFAGQCNVENALINQCDFSNSSIRSTILTKLRCIDSDFVNADFSNSRLTNAFLIRTNLQRAQFYRAELRQCQVDYCDCLDSSFMGAYMLETTFKNASCFGAAFLRARLDAVKFIESDLHDTILEKRV